MTKLKFKIKSVLFKLLNSLNNSIEWYLKLKIKFGFINENLSPRMCEFCGSQKFEFKTTDWFDGHIIMEQDCICKNCNKVIGHCITGYWEPF